MGNFGLMECRAAVITELKGPLEIWTVPIPELEPGGVLIRIDAATLCGTDASRWSGRVVRPTPFVPGHETSGTIVDTNGPVCDILGEPLKAGDRIVCSYPTCGHCYFCQVSRQTSLCTETFPFGDAHPNKLLGGCAEYHVFPARGHLIRVPAEVPPVLAAASACALRTVVHGFELLGRIDNHETVVVQGAGPLGLFAAALARDRGAKQVLLIGAPAGRLAVAADFGADAALDIDIVTDAGARLQWVRELTGGRGADIVINCATAPALVEALQLARRGARVVNLGQGHAAEMTIPSSVLWKQIRIDMVVMAEARHWLQALEFLASRRNDFPFEKMISNSFTLEGTTEALRGMDAYREIKPVIYPHSTN